MKEQKAVSAKVRLMIETLTLGKLDFADDRSKEGNIMFIAMNRFQIIRGQEDAFEEVWRKRDTYLNEVPGFREFRLLRGQTEEEFTLYASHSVWESGEAFERWTKSESFRKAHAQAGSNKPLYLGHPRFEGFEVILTEGSST